MQSQTRILGTDISLNKLPASVKHAHKYSTGSGMYGFNLLFVQTATDVVFRLPRTGTDCHFTLSGNDLPIYPAQEVELIIANDMIIGFIDSSTRRYYYLVDGFNKLFGIQRWVWQVGIGFGVALLAAGFLLNSEYRQNCFVAALLMIPLTYLYQLGLNWWIERKLDAAIEADENRQWL